MATMITEVLHEELELMDFIITQTKDHKLHWGNIGTDTYFSRTDGFFLRVDSNERTVSLNLVNGDNDLYIVDTNNTAEVRDKLKLLIETVKNNTQGDFIQFDYIEELDKTIIEVISDLVARTEKDKITWIAVSEHCYSVPIGYTEDFDRVDVLWYNGAYKLRIINTVTGIKIYSQPPRLIEMLFDTVESQLS